MSEWYWRVIALKTAFILSCFVSYLRGQDTLKQLPYCNPHVNNGNPNHNDLVLVSTLDGKLSAFVTSNGVKAWDIDTKPLLSSNLHHVELTSGGKWVRLVPSLRGALYSVSGDNVEPLPFDADQLLSSSFKYSEDLVIAGSRETLWTGIEPSSGRILYNCGTRGCDGEQRKDTTGRVLVLRRHSSTVRALDPRTGTEKWNFSVGEHQVALSGECRGGSPHAPDYDVGVALPDGVVNVRSTDSTALLWQLKLSSPIAGLWRVRGGSLQPLDVLWAATRALSQDTHVQTTPPSLYIGIHEHQLYIQEGLLYAQKIETAVSAKPVPWKLKHSRPLLTGPETAVQLQNSDPNTLALITLYGNIGQDENQGYFLYDEETCDQAVQTTPPQIGAEEAAGGGEHSEGGGEHHHVHVHVYSLWFWWKEVLLIAVSSALLMNLMIWPRFFAPKLPLQSSVPLNQEYIVVEHHYEKSPPPSPEYVGRYESDFTPLRCLGRGGFGVVFEARNNIDHCSYAVKRITLPKRESKRERVLREVRALAKLEHEHIVRYFNAWLEEPPAHWQEARDQLLMRELEGTSLSMEEYPSVKSSSVTAPHQSKVASPGSVLLNMKDPHDYEGQLSEPSRRHRSQSCSDSCSIVFDHNNSKDPSFSKSDKTTLQMDALENLEIPKGLTLSKNLGERDDDSFIVFANSEDINHNNSEGLSEARNDVSYNKNKQLDRVKDSDLTKTEASSHTKKKKKGHTRHWSLDLCVKSRDGQQSNNKMYLYIQMQLCLRESLHDWLRRNNSFEARRDKVKILFSQIVSAVEYVHLAGLIHRDLKPSNIFFAPDGKVKVGDFGLVTAMSDSSQDGEDIPDNIKVHTRHTYRVGTHLYMSPEQLRGRPYSYKVDIYSLGLVLFELLQPFCTEAERVVCLQALRQGHFPKTFHQLHPNEMEVLKLMLSEDPSRRPTAIGVRARAPLYQQTDEKWHFTLPNLVTS